MYERLIIKDLDIITFITSAPTQNRRTLHDIAHDLKVFLLKSSGVVVYKSVVVSEIRDAYFRSKDKERDYDSYVYYINNVVVTRGMKSYKLPSTSKLNTINSLLPLLYFCHLSIYKSDVFKNIYGPGARPERSLTVKYLYNYMSSALYSEEVADKFFDSLPFPIDECMYLFRMCYDDMVEEELKKRKTTYSGLLPSKGFD